MRENARMEFSEIALRCGISSVQEAALEALNRGERAKAEILCFS